MKLLPKLFLLIICVIILPILSVVGLTYFKINQSITSIETNKGELNIDHTKKYLDSLLENQIGSLGSWLPWEDLYKNVGIGDSKWLAANVGASCAEDSPNELFIILDKDYKPLYLTDSVPKQWKASGFKSLKILQKLEATNTFLADFDISSDSTYILSAGKICAPSDTNQKHPDGYFINGRKLNNKLIEKGKKIVDVDITIKFLNSYTVSTLAKPLLLNSSDSFKTTEVKSITKTQNNYMLVKAEALLKDTSGNALGLLQVETRSTSGITALHKLSLYSIILVILVLLLSILILIWMNTGIITPIKRITNIISRKDLSELTNFKSRDEIGVLSREFDSFISGLTSNLKLLKTSTNNVEAIGTALTYSSEESHTSMDEISLSIESSSEKLDENLSKLDTISEEIANATESGKEINEILLKLEAESNRINLIANEGITSFGEINTGVLITKEKFNITMDSNSRLMNSIQSVIEFTELIGQISMQSNLLALNASIEAARAGEAGKGFAIVSNEVGILSVQTKEAVEKLKKIIDEIMKTTQLSNASLNEVNDQINKTEAIASSAQTEIGLILSSVLNVVNSITIIAAQSISEEASLIDIKSNIENIKETFKELRDYFEDINTASSTQLSTTEALSIKAHDLTSTINLLNGMINQFKGI